MSRRYLFSGSSFGRVEACPASAALSHVDWDSSEARRGTGLHAFLAAVNNGVARDAALHAIDDPETRAWAEKIDVDALPAGLPEKSIAYDPVTGFARFTGDTARRYSIEHGEIPMTLDLIVPGDDHDGSGPTVIDWKTTAYAHDVAYDVPQLEINCLGAAAALGASKAAWAVGVITPDGAVAWRRGQLDAAALASVADRVRHTIRSANDERYNRSMAEQGGEPYVPDVRRGPHCRWCPAFLACPATLSMLRVVFESGGLDAVQAEPGPAYVCVQAVERFAVMARELIKQHVTEHGPSETGDGRRLTLNSKGHLKLESA